MRMSKKRNVSMRMSMKRKVSLKKRASEMNAVNWRRQSNERRRLDQACEDDSLELPASLSAMSSSEGESDSGEEYEGILAEDDISLIYQDWQLIGSKI